MKSGNYLPNLVKSILAGLAAHPVVRITCQRPRSLARTLEKELRMCDIKVEKENTQRVGRFKIITGVLAIKWKAVQ